MKLLAGTVPAGGTQSGFVNRAVCRAVNFLGRYVVLGYIRKISFSFNELASYKPEVEQTTIT